jgi:hypothetical protein
MTGSKSHTNSFRHNVVKEDYKAYGVSLVTISSNSLSERPSLRWPVDCKASSYETQGKIIRNALF